MAKQKLVRNMCNIQLLCNQNYKNFKGEIFLILWAVLISFQKLNKNLLLISDSLCFNDFAGKWYSPNMFSYLLVSVKGSVIKLCFFPLIYFFALVWTCISNWHDSRKSISSICIWSYTKQYKCYMCNSMTSVAEY